MLQTRDGFLWIGTRGGLARFDGANFVLYKPKVPDSIPGESVTGLAEDRDGSLWISSDGGLSRYGNGSFHNFSRRDGLPEDSIWRVAKDNAGGVWAVTWRSQLFHFDGRSVRRYEAPFSGRPQEVNAMAEDTHGTLWIATFHGLFALDPGGSFKTFTHNDGLAGDRVYALALNRGGQLWAAGDGGLTHLVPGHLARIAIPELATATLLAFDLSDKDDSTFWTGSTGKGLFRLNFRGVQRLRAAQGLISDELYLLYCSRDGSLWAGAIDGLNELSDGTITSYSTGEGLPGSTLGMQRAQGLNDELWFGHGRFKAHVQDGILSLLGPAPVTVRDRLRESKPAEETSGGLQAISLWVRSSEPHNRGLVLTDQSGNGVLSDGAVQRALPRVPWNSVGALLIAREGTVWAAGSEIGVIAYPAGGPARSFTVANGLDSNNVLSLAEDREGSIWVGTISGLHRITNGRVTHVISCADVTSITPSADGSVWVSSESGLIYVPPAPAPVRIFTRRDGLPTSLIKGVAEDTEGDLWLGTEQGIVRVRKADLFIPEHRFQAAPLVFGVGDGLHSAQLRTNSVFRSRRGDIWFLTMAELGMLDPRRIKATPLAAIVMDAVKIDDKDASHAPVTSLTVPAGRHRLTIRYTLPEFRIPGRIHFRYRLEGWDKDWIPAGSLREATYTGIPPGTYTFRVEHSDGYGNWGSGETAMDIRVAPYFYQTGWFLTLMALMMAGLIWQLHRFRVAQVRAGINARMQERTRIARELHDTLLQGMLGVSMQMYAASQQALDPGSFSTMLGRASQRLREIAEQSRRAVEDLRASPMSPDSLETALSSAVREMDLPSAIKHYVHSAGVPIHVRPEVQSEIGRIAREAVANAVQHSGANAIRLDILYQPAHLFVSVSDNGCGLKPDALASGRYGHWGITGMLERARSVGGHLRILPNTPQGTVVEVSVPGATAYIKLPLRQAKILWESLLRRLRNQPE